MNRYIEIIDRFNYEQAPSSGAACTIVKQWYGQYCPFSGLHKSVLGPGGLTGSHILPAGRHGNRYVGLSRYPLGVIPMSLELHNEYELLTPQEKFLWIDYHSRISDFRPAVKEHLRRFLVLMSYVHLSPLEFTGSGK